jgi:hypothetical protein
MNTSSLHSAANASRLRWCLIILPFLVTTSTAQHIDIQGPAGSVEFGKSVNVLPNGNIVVTDQYFSTSTATNVGAVYLYSPHGTLISTLTGSTEGDEIGNAPQTVSPGPGVVVLANGNFVVLSFQWHNGSIVQAGAVTWGSAVTGVSGVVSSSNSLVGTSVSDHVGANVIALSNGNYVAISPFWNGYRGAATWGDGSTGTSGAVSPSNSLVGGIASDQVAYNGVRALSNGNYVVMSSTWNGGLGATTWGDGMSGTTGTVSSSNSLLGSTSNNANGNGPFYGVTALVNGNYVVGSPNWNGGLGAATWGNGRSGISGSISSSNSLVGTTIGDNVGAAILALTNGNYVVTSLSRNGGKGAATWGNGNVGIVGAISSRNSLVGSSGFGAVGVGAVALTNGNYVVITGGDIGAATWGNGTVGTVGSVSLSNSLVGSVAGDEVGYGGVTALSNGNYVVDSSQWNDTMGAVTWGNGASGTTGTVSSSNSLVGSAFGDFVASSVTALANGNYVIDSSTWNIDEGAVTWGNGSGGTAGAISSSNSLLGDGVGGGVVTALSNGNYAVQSPYWNEGYGAVTWGGGTKGTIGTVSANISVLGNTDKDALSSGGITALSGGSYVVVSPDWSENGTMTGAGAVTLARGSGPLTGTLNAYNSVFGGVAGSGSSMVFGYDALHDQLVVGRPTENIVTLFKADEIFESGFE